MADGGTLRIVRREGGATHRLRGAATTALSTDQLMELLRGE